MEIQKLKKKLLREEMRRRRRNSKSFRLLVGGGLLLTGLLFVNLLFSVYNSDRALEEEYSRAEELVESGAYEEAVSLLRAIYDRQPGFPLAPKALYQAGEILNLFLSRHHEALLAFLLIEKDFPTHELVVPAQRQIAEIYKYRLRDYGRAIVAYQKLLDRGDTGGDRLQQEIADSYFRLENFEQARIEFETLARHYPESPLLPEVHYRIAVTYSLEEQPEQAAETFRLVMQKWPDSSYAMESRFGLAAVLEDRDHLSEALEILEGLRGEYPNTEVLARKTEQVRERIRKKKTL